MKNVTLANTSGDTKVVNVHVSFGYLFLGPIYHLIKLMIVRGLLLSLVYVMIIWKGFFLVFKNLLIIKKSSDLNYYERFTKKLTRSVNCTYNSIF